MFGFRPKLPVTEKQRQWIDDSFNRLSQVLGRDRMLGAKVILPDADHFPDRYDGTEATLESLFQRICGYMRVERSRIDLEVFHDETERLKEVMPYWRGDPGGPAGLYTRTEDRSRMIIALKETQLKNPLGLVATLAHELGHAILLGDDLIDRDAPDMEPLTDLITVFLGLGIFTANAAMQFEQHQNVRTQGWSTHRLGYLPEEMYGYALAKFATERGEDRPEWIRHLSTNVKAYYKKSRAWLLQNPADKHSAVAKHDN